MTRDQKKEVERLYENEGMSYGGIARMLGLPKSTVSSHLMRKRSKTVIPQSKPTTHEYCCTLCGKELEVISGKKIKKFC